MLNRYIHFTEGGTSLVLSMPHSALEIPDDLDHHLSNSPDAQRTLRSGVDYSVPFATGFHGYEGPTKIWTAIPRVLLDVNRHRDMVDSRACKSYHGVYSHGIIWAASLAESHEDIQDILTRPYSNEELETLLELGYDPYTQSVDQAMVDTLNNHGIAILFDLHSMWGNVLEYGKGDNDGAYVVGSSMDEERPALVLLDKGETVCSSVISNLIMEVFQDHNLSIDRGTVLRSSRPSFISTYADPEKGKHAISIEINERHLVPGRQAGILSYTGVLESDLKKAFQECFRALEQTSP